MAKLQEVIGEVGVSCFFPDPILRDSTLIAIIACSAPITGISSYDVFHRWVKAASVTNGPGSVEIWYAHNASGSWDLQRVTVLAGRGEVGVVHLSEWSGLISREIPIDAVSASGNSVDPLTLNYAAGPGANYVVIAAGGWTANNYVTGPTGGFTRMTAAGAGATWLESAYRQQAPPDSYSTGWTLSAAIPWGACICAFEEWDPTRPAIRSHVEGECTTDVVLALPPAIEVGDLLYGVVHLDSANGTLTIPDLDWEITLAGNTVDSTYYVVSHVVTSYDVGRGYVYFETFDIVAFACLVAVKKVFIRPSGDLSVSFTSDSGLIEVPSVNYQISDFLLVMAAGKTILNQFTLPSSLMSYQEVHIDLGGGSKFNVAMAYSHPLGAGSFPEDIIVSNVGGVSFISFAASIRAILAALCRVQARVMGTDGRPKSGVSMTVTPLRVGSAEVRDVLVQKEAISATSVDGFVAIDVVRSDELELHQTDPDDTPNYSISIGDLGILEPDVDLDVNTYDLGEVLGA